MIELRSYGELDAFVKALNLFNKEHFFNIRRDDGSIDDWQADTHQDAEARSSDKFSIDCQQDFLSEDELCEEQSEILVIGYDDDEEEVIIASLPITLEYKNERSERSEHFNQRYFV